MVIYFFLLIWKTKLLPFEQEELDVDPRRDGDASPMSSYRCMLRPT